MLREPIHLNHEQIVGAADRLARGRSADLVQRGPCGIGMWRAAFNRAVAVKDLTEVVKVLVAKAKDGDIKAIEVLLNRLCGKPQESRLNVDVDATDLASSSGEEAKAKLRELIMPYLMGGDGGGPEPQAQKEIEGRVEVLPEVKEKAEAVPGGGLFRMRT